MSLWILFQSDQHKQFPQNRMQIIPTQIQRTSFCICNSASYTLEAAVVIPLLAGYLVTILFFFTVLDIQCEVKEALLYAGRKTAVESSVVESEELLFVSAEASMLYVLKESEQIEKYVENGMWGISLLGSRIASDYILLKADYTIKLPISIFEIGQINVSSQHVFKRWTGDKKLEEDEDDAYVYVTPTGEVYHGKLTCRVINLSVKQTTIDRISSLRGKNGQKYYECSRCEWGDSKKERVYYTDYGELYHKNIACNAIKRTVEKIPIEDIGSRRPCSFCYGL